MPKNKTSVAVPVAAEAPETIIKVPGEIEVVMEKLNTLFFREELATGKLKDGTKFEVSRNVGGGFFHFNVGNRYYSMKLESIVEVFIKARDIAIEQKLNP